MRPDSFLNILVIKVCSGRRRAEGSESLALCRENKGLPSIRCQPSTPHPGDYRCDFVKVCYGPSSVSMDSGYQAHLVLMLQWWCLLFAASAMMATEAPPLPLGPVSLTFSPDAKNKNLKSIIEWKVLHKNQLPRSSPWLS